MALVAGKEGFRESWEWEYLAAAIILLKGALLLRLPSRCRPPHIPILGRKRKTTISKNAVSHTLFFHNSSGFNFFGISYKLSLSYFFLWVWDDFIFGCTRRRHSPSHHWHVSCGWAVAFSFFTIFQKTDPDPYSTGAYLAKLNRRSWDRKWVHEISREKYRRNFQEKEKTKPNTLTKSTKIGENFAANPRILLVSSSGFALHQFMTQGYVVPVSVF